MPINYKVLIGSTPQDLESKVAEHFSLGYVLQGGLAIGMIDATHVNKDIDILIVGGQINTLIFCQAVILTSPNP